MSDDQYVIAFSLQCQKQHVANTELFVCWHYCSYLVHGPLFYATACRYGWLVTLFTGLPVQTRVSLGMRLVGLVTYLNFHSKRSADQSKIAA